MIANRRADAQRSRAAVLDAAVRLLGTRPDASVEAIATAAGVTRQTVYAHFPNRDRLLAAVVDRLTQETAAAMDAAMDATMDATGTGTGNGHDAATGPVAGALLRMLDAAAEIAGRYPGLLEKISSLAVPPQEDHERHTLISDRLLRVIRRGQDSGEFDDRLPTGWLVAATVKLAHAAAEEAAAGRLSQPEATRAFHTSLLRILGRPNPHQNGSTEPTP